jgi:serine phosphatase RsbU (regulator of sigma subunit)
MNKPTVFLSYNIIDQPLVVAIQKLLEARGIATFIDRGRTAPGLPWPIALEEGLRGVRAVAVFIGRQLGESQKREMYFALDRQVWEERQDHSFPVIPVLLAGADLNWGFLFLNTWIDLRRGLDSVSMAEALDVFERAITAAEPAGTMWMRALRRLRTAGFLAPPSFILIPTCASTPKHSRSPERTVIHCPYRGLEPFREEHAAFFAGRTALTRQLFDFTLGKDLVALVGPSGSGKSSVVHSGLVPLLRRELPPATTWDVVTFTPGCDPFLRLASALIPLLEQDLNETDRLTEAEKLREQLATGEVHLQSVVDRVIEKSNGTGRLLVVADQFEELFTLTAEVEQRPFALALLRALGKACFTLLVTLRADFYGQMITLDPALCDRLAPAQVNVGALTYDELRESVASPAKLVGLEFEAGLVDRILHDAGREPANLPLLEFALATLWSRREGRSLTHRAYNQIAGVTGALGQRAEAEFSRFTPEEQTAVRRLFSRLVHVAKPGEGALGVRQRIELQATDPLAQKVAQALAESDVRLLMLGHSEGHGQTKSQTVEVTHEALIRTWDRLQNWINEDLGFILWRQLTETQVEQWEQHGRDASYLLRALPRFEAGGCWAGKFEDLSTTARQFIEEGIALREQARPLLPMKVTEFLFLSVSAAFVECESVGGDFYDVFALDQKRVAFVVGEVNGKGLGVAVLATVLQGVFAVSMALDTDPARAFNHVNRFLCSHAEVGRYATMFFGILDDSGKMEFINAGHPSPILMRHETAEEAFVEGSFPVGLVPEAEFSTTTLHLEPNDTLVLFSDGVTEAMDPEDQLYGVGRLRAVLLGKNEMPLDEMRKAVLESVANFARGAPQADDLTLLLVRYRGEAVL